MKFSLFVLFLLVFVAPVGSRASDLTIQAEDYLWCPGIKPTDAHRAALTKIIEERRALARNITLTEMPNTMTFFGLRIDEPSEILAWREKEDLRVRALIEPTELDQVKKFANSVRNHIARVDQKFPLLQSIGLKMTHSITESDGGKELKLDLSVPAESPDYKMMHQVETTNGGALVIRVTLVRPSFYQLLAREPEISELKTTVTRNGTLPKTVEVWTRTIDEDLPLNLKFSRVGVIEVSGS